MIGGKGMSLCGNCETKIASGIKFCPNCGKSTSETDQNGKQENLDDVFEMFSGEPSVQSQNNDSRYKRQRRMEFVGSIKKCPSCGAELPSLTAICPICEHEINQVQISSSLITFIDAIDQCDRDIASSPSSSKKGWISWSKTARTFWVILNVYTLCIPLMIYFIAPMFRYGTTPSLSTAEKKKSALIENFIFPNDRESILEALLFIKSKTEFLASENLNTQTAYWARLWKAKAEQLYHKAQIVMKHDEVAQNAYSGVQKNDKRIKDKVKFKALVGGVILVAILSIIFVVGINSYSAEHTSYVNHIGTFTWFEQR